MQVTTLIRTLGRETLTDSISSALREGFKVIVLGDAVNVSRFSQKNVDVFWTQKKQPDYGMYLLNVGAYMAQTPYVSILDDDDVYIEGAGDIIRSRLGEANIMIPGLLYNDGHVMCMDKGPGVVVGNIACPIYETQLLYQIPFMKNFDPKMDYISDAIHIIMSTQIGKTIAWYGQPLISVRPKLEGTNGRGLK